MSSEVETIWDVRELQKIIPHRYPFLLIDKVIEFEDSKRIVAIKNVTINEPFFQGHFPGLPVMPGVLILESLAQVGAVLAHKSSISEEATAGKTMMIVGANDVKWKRQVTPGDTLHIEMVFEKRRKPLWFLNGTVKVGNQVCCTALITAAEVSHSS
jgi:3-hydroxyacyl-[acyl-carrier-protein] dehydratase